MSKDDSAPDNASRRGFVVGTGMLATGAVMGLARSAKAAGATAAGSQDSTPGHSADSSDQGMGDIRKTNTAVVFIDPQNDVLSDKGVNWGAVGASVTENRTVENMTKIFAAAKKLGYNVFISPHFFYPTDYGWQYYDPLETEEVKNKSFARQGPLNLTGLKGSGADWLEQFKPYIEDGKTIVVSPHKVWGPETNDLVLQLRKRGVQKVILGGMLANMCVESHLRELLEQGFQVAVIKDATAGPRHPVWGDGYKAALVNYNFLAHAVWTTDEVVGKMQPGTVG